jgi:hypothetical protein
VGGAVNITQTVGLINFLLKKGFKSISLNFIAKFVVRIKPFALKTIYYTYR